MKNIIFEDSPVELHGRLLFSTKFVANADIFKKKILDIGCGYGWFEINVLDRTPKLIVASELSNADLATAKRSLKDKKIKFCVSDVLRLQFAHNYFDTVVCWEVIEHLVEGKEDLMFRQIVKVLKPGGSLYLSCPNKSMPSVIFDPAWWFFSHRHYSESFLIQLAENNGFVIEKVAVKGRFWELFFILNLYLSKWLFRRKSLFFENFVNRKVDGDFQGIGFMDLFLKFKKSG